MKKAPELDVPTASVISNLIEINAKVEIMIRLQSAILAHLTDQDSVEVANRYLADADSLIIEHGSVFNAARQKAHQQSEEAEESDE